MSKTAFSVDESPFLLPFAAVVETLAAFDVSFQRKEKEICLKDARRVLTGEIVEAVRAHKADLLILCDCRSELTRLHEYIVRLRCEDPPRGSREKAFAYQGAQIEKLAGLSVSIGGTKSGWPAPADVFADMDQIEGLRQALTELTRADAPYPVPLPPGCRLLPQANSDPFAHGRYYSGKLIGAP